MLPESTHHFECLLATTSQDLGRSWEVFGYLLPESIYPSAHFPPGEVPEGSASFIRVKKLREGGLAFWASYSVVPGVSVASEVDQPDIVALLGHHEPKALVGEDLADCQCE